MLLTGLQASDNLPAKVSITGSGYEIKILKNDNKAYGNRKWVWKNVPEQFKSYSYTQTSQEGKANITINASTTGDVFVAVPVKRLDEFLKDQIGWRKVASSMFHFNNKQKTTLIILKKKIFKKGKIKVKQVGTSGSIVIYKKEN